MRGCVVVSILGGIGFGVELVVSVLIDRDEGNHCRGNIGLCGGCCGFFASFTTSHFKAAHRGDPGTQGNENEGGRATGGLWGFGG